MDGAHSEEALAISVLLLGAKLGSKAMDNTLSAFAVNNTVVLTIVSLKYTVPVDYSA